MFKMLKYIFIVNIYKKTKSNVVAVGMAVSFLFLTAFVSSDFIGATQGSEKYILILLKWLAIGLLLWVIVRNVKKIWKVATDSVQLKMSEPTNKDLKKERILGKDRLQSRSDLILKKYKKVS